MTEITTQYSICTEKKLSFMSSFAIISVIETENELLYVYPWE